jgi:tetratricopeptide (TPR) repeat protein
LGTPPAEVFPLARAAAEKALAIRETNAEAHNALANVMFWYQRNWKEAERHFTRAVEINPSFSPAHHDYAFLLVAMGRTEAALTSLRRAIALDPLSARVNVDAGWLLLQAHRFDQAIVQARRSLDLEPGLAEADSCITRALLYQRKYQAVLEQLKQTPAGGDAEARLKSLFRAKLQEGGDPIMLAMRYAFLGEKSHALDELEIAYQRRSSMMPLLKTEPSFEPLHGEKRFQELARKVGLQ